MSQPDAEDLLLEWQEKFKSSDWFVTRDEKTRFNYFKARSLYFGTSMKGEASKGFQQYYLDAAARPSKENTAIISKAVELLLKAGIDLTAHYELLSADPSFIVHCNNIFRAFANPRNQYEFKVSDPIQHRTRGHTTDWQRSYPGRRRLLHHLRPVSVSLTDM
jgi:hypothetical protein